MGSRVINLQNIDSSDSFQLIETSRAGIDYADFENIVQDFPFELTEWSKILHISERTIQRYKRDKKRFDSIHSDRFLQIVMLLRKGIDVFGDSDNFFIWLNAKSIALGGVKPIELLDSFFGIKMVTDELIRIEHGVLA
jgi:putative toxin-antitoxin system antitoxin component (TIGR02293 family)